MFSGHTIKDLIDHYNVDMSLYTPSVQRRFNKRDFVNLIAEMKIKYKDFTRIPDYDINKYSTHYAYTYGHKYEYK